MTQQAIPLLPPWRRITLRLGVQSNTSQLRAATYTAGRAMKHWRKQLIVGLALLLVVCAIAVVADPTCVLLRLLRNESFYQGRPTSYWSREIRRARDIEASDALSTAQDWFSNLFRPNKWTRAEDTNLLKGGAEAAPVLKELLRDKNPGVRSTAA